MFSHYSFHVNISIILKSNFTEKKDIYKHYMYEHISYDYAWLFMYVYTYLYIFMHEKLFALAFYILLYIRYHDKA